METIRELSSLYFTDDAWFGHNIDDIRKKMRLFKERGGCMGQIIALRTLLEKYMEMKKYLLFHNIYGLRECELQGRLSSFVMAAAAEYSKYYKQLKPSTRTARVL